MSIVYDRVTGDIDVEATEKEEEKQGLAMFVLLLGTIVFMAWVTS